jgi:hypothetical protein
MFFKKNSSPKTVAKRKNEDIIWDQKTVEHFTKSNQIEVQITNVGKRMGFGSMHEGEPMTDPNGYEVTGIISYPKFILVSISFDAISENFGGWCYTVYNHARKPTNIGIPLLELYLSDPDFKMAAAIFGAHQAALLSGKRFSWAKLFKRRGDGVMTTEERERGYSKHYPLIGLYTWAELESQTLPAWAVPYGCDRFSVENLPEPYDLNL